MSNTATIDVVGEYEKETKVLLINFLNKSKFKMENLQLETHDSE